MRWLVGGGLALCLGSVLLGTLLTWWYRMPPGMYPSQRYDPPLLLLFFVIVGGLGVLAGVAGVVLDALMRRRVQLCPRCFSTMRAGAAVCPWCRFQDKEAARAVAPQG
jgi:hypothetical protein